MARRFACLPLLAVLCALPTRADDGLLQKVRDEVKKPEKPATTPPRAKHKDDASHQDDASDDDSDDDLKGALGELGLWALAAPFLLPPLALEDDYRSRCLFPRYPYAYGRYGYLWVDRVVEKDDPPNPEPRGARGWSVRPAVEDGYDFHGVNRFGVRAAVDTASRFGLTTGWDFFHENLSGGRSDDLTLGDLNLTFRFAQCEWMQMYTGLGGRLLTSRGDTRGGFNFTYGADAFPCKPLVLSSSFDLGTVGSASLVHARGTVGLVHRRCEVFAGYDFLRIGSVNLQGPTAGLRLWF
jgi:hypothetical protein